jgi:hypothetical protein
MLWISSVTRKPPVELERHVSMEVQNPIYQQLFITLPAVDVGFAPALDISVTYIYI